MSLENSASFVIHTFQHYLGTAHTYLLVTFSKSRPCYLAMILNAAQKKVDKLALVFLTSLSSSGVTTAHHLPPFHPITIASSP